jgi:hypothetical protein
VWSLPVVLHLMLQPVCFLLLLSDLRVSSCVLSLVGCFLTAAPTWDAGPVCWVGCTGIVARTAMSALDGLLALHPGLRCGCVFPGRRSV